MRLGILASAVFWGAMFVFSGCSMAGSAGENVTFSGSPQAIRAYMDGLNGLITNAKTQDPLGNSAAWQHRYAEEQEITKRSMPLGFWQRLTQSEPSTTTQTDTHQGS